MAYRNNLKNREIKDEACSPFDKKDPQNFQSEQVTIADRQSAIENRNFEANPTQTKTDPSDDFSIKPWFEEGLRFKCTGCGGCCTGTPGYVFLSLEDLDRLAMHLQCTPLEFAKKYTRQVDGGYALLDRSQTYDCIFLDGKRCSVYESRPVQCRTFPWWIQNLRDSKDWQAASERCEGINHPDAPIVPSLHIQEQCMTYLDNLIEQNFSLTESHL